MVLQNNEIYFSKRNEWRSWLEKNHATAKEIWLVYFKKDSGKPRISYEDAVEEAICFGWIDSTIKRIDEEKFCQKYTPRKEKSRWSELNKKRAEKMIRMGLMTKSGMGKIRKAKKCGEWVKKPADINISEIPSELKVALHDQAIAREKYILLSPFSKKQIVGWIKAAKKLKTRQKRVAEVIDLLKKNQKLGMK